MDIFFQSALGEALRYGYVALNLLATRARQAAKRAPDGGPKQHEKATPAFTIKQTV
jgi:hypothetical protein